jgi:hypothetical protein
MLLRRTVLPVPDAVERLVGMQAQVPAAPYLGLWNRIDGFRPQDLAALIADRSLVRASLMRATIHLVTVRDFGALYPLVRPVLARLFANRMSTMDIDAVLAAGLAALEDSPRTGPGLRDVLSPRWPQHDPDALVLAVRYLLPLVQVPPRGLWDSTGPPTWTTARAWLGTDVDFDAEPDTVVLRYLAAFGPATVADVRAWSGLTGLRDAVERLRPQLRTFSDEHGRELLDVADGPLPDPDVPAPPRLLADFDNVLLSHADRGRIIAPEHHKRINAERIQRYVLVDGFFAGTWRIERRRTAATMYVEPFVRVSKKDSVLLTEEAARLHAFLAPDASPEVRLLPPT